MPENQEQQQHDEKRIVEAFLQVANIPYYPDSIQSIEPPQPDIICTLKNDTQLAFELTEVIDPKLARNYNFSIDVKGAMYQYYADMEPTKREQMAHLFRNADLFIAFVDGTTLKKVVNLLPSLFDFLLNCTSEIEGNIKKDILPKSIKRISVARGEFVGPMFNASGLALYIKNMMTERITEKFSKEYECNFPIELLVHSSLVSLQPEILWLDKVHNLVPANVQNSPFQRVWIFDYVESNIIYVYPDL